jgi:hypothetical protein
MCYRLKPIGNKCLVQKFTEINITIGAKKTPCGYEPFYNDKTIEKDFYTLYPFSECFWEDGIVNFIGKPYMCKKETNDWSYVQPTTHQSTMRLALQCNEINDNEANYQLNHYEFYQKLKFEKINTINQLATRIYIAEAGTGTVALTHQ